MGIDDLAEDDLRRSALSAQRGELHRNGDRVYLGSLDDSVSRYPWEHLEPSLEHLNRTLIDAVLFGARLCVRSGNLLYQPTYLPALLDSSASPLIDLARVGFIQIQTINKGINNSIETRLNEGTRSAQLFAAAHDWRPGSAIYEQLRSLESTLHDGEGIVQYNANFRKMFRKIMRESESSGVDEFAKVFAVWSGRPKEGLGYQSRDNFEHDAIAMFPHDPIAVKKAMWVANAANHYAYALQLYNPATGAKPMVETSQFDRHAEVCAIRETVSAEQASEILGKENSVNSALRIVQIPEEVYHPQFWPKLAQLMRPDDDARDEADTRARLLRRNFVYAKQELASKIDFFLNNPDKFNEKAILDPSREYSERLRDALGIRRESRLRLRLNLALQQARVSGATAALSNVTTTAAGAAAALALAGTPGAGAVAGFAIGFMLEVLGLNVGDILLRVSKHKVTKDGIVDVENEGSAGAALGRQAENRFGSYVGIRSISAAKAAKLMANLNEEG